MYSHNIEICKVIDLTLQYITVFQGNFKNDCKPTNACILKSPKHMTSSTWQVPSFFKMPYSVMNKIQTNWTKHDLKSKERLHLKSCVQTTYWKSKVFTDDCMYRKIINNLIPPNEKNDKKWYSFYYCELWSPSHIKTHTWLVHHMILLICISSTSSADETRLGAWGG